MGSPWELLLLKGRRKRESVVEKYSTFLYIFNTVAMTIGLGASLSTDALNNLNLSTPHLTTEAFVVNGNFVSNIANTQNATGAPSTAQATITADLTTSPTDLESLLPINGNLPAVPSEADLIDFNTRNYKDIEYFSTTDSLFLLPFSNNNSQGDPIPQGIYQYNSSTTRPTLVVSASTLGTEETLEFLYSDNNGNLFATTIAEPRPLSPHHIGNSSLLSRFRQPNIN